jgi:hypothetical protein
VDLVVTDQLLSRYSVFVTYWREKWDYSGTLYQLFIDSEKAYDSVNIEVCTILSLDLMCT